MKHLLFAACLLLPVACYAEVSQEPATGGDPVAATVVPRAVHDVECGCRIDAIGKCGNYVSLDGAYLPIASDTGVGAELGSMEWCSHPGSTAELEGSVEDGKFVATYLKTIQP